MGRTVSTRAQIIHTMKKPVKIFKLLNICRDCGMVSGKSGNFYNIDDPNQLDSFYKSLIKSFSDMGFKRMIYLNESGGNLDHKNRNVKRKDSYWMVIKDHTLGTKVFDPANPDYDKMNNYLVDNYKRKNQAKYNNKRATVR